MKPKITVIGTLNEKTGQATIRAEKVKGQGSRLIPCPACGAMTEQERAAAARNHT